MYGIHFGARLRVCGPVRRASLLFSGHLYFLTVDFPSFFFFLIRKSSRSEEIVRQSVGRFIYYLTNRLPHRPYPQIMLVQPWLGRLWRINSCNWAKGTKIEGQPFRETDPLFCLHHPGSNQVLRRLSLTTLQIEQVDHIAHRLSVRTCSLAAQKLYICAYSCILF